MQSLEFGSGHELIEPLLENSDEGKTVVGFDFGLLNLFLELLEWLVVG